MRTIHDYLDAALKTQNITADSDLADMMKITRSSISAFRRGKAFPTEENMVKLARLSGMDEQVALLELAFMSSQGEAKSTYEKILKRISSFLPATLLGLFAAHPTTAHAAEIMRENAASLPHSGIAESVSGIAIIMYIMKNNTSYITSSYLVL